MLCIHQYFLLAQFHDSCGGMKRLSYWNDGSSSSTQPRALHDMHNVVLLVSAVYACDSGHRLLALDESVLNRFPTYRLYCC